MKMYIIVAIVILVAVGCKSMQSTSSAGEENLYKYHWTVSEFQGQTAAASRTPFLEFAKENEVRVSGFAGCNRLSGTLSISGSVLKFSPLITTKMACADGYDEMPFLHALAKTSSYKISGTELSFFSGDTTVAKFKGEPR